MLYYVNKLKQLRKSCGTAETVPSKIDVCAVTCALHGPCLLTGYVKISAMELLCHVIVKEEVQQLVERNIIIEIIRNGGGPLGQ